MTTLIYSMSGIWIISKKHGRLVMPYSWASMETMQRKTSKAMDGLLSRRRNGYA